MTKSLKLCLLTPLLLVLMSFQINPNQSTEESNIPTLSFHFEKQVNRNLNFNDDDDLSRRNPSRKKIFTYMCEVGTKYNIPPEILYAIAYAESEFKQYDNKGNPFVSFDNGIGIMQVTPDKAPIKFDIERAKYDYKYNILTGARIILEKWKDQENVRELYGKTGTLLPALGSKDPMILENWYFVLWAYNGYARENNPNFLPMYISKLEGFKSKAYQDRVIDLANNDLRIKITKFPSEMLPKNQGLPDVSSSFPTPEPKHYSILSRENLEMDLKHDVAKLFSDKKTELN